MKPNLYLEYSRIFDLFSSPKLFPSLLDFVIKTVEHAPSGTKAVSDIGAGTGYFTEFLQGEFKDAKFTVVEPSHEMIRQAKERLDVNRTCFLQVLAKEALAGLRDQDIFVYQRALYSFSGDLKYYEQLAEMTAAATRADGILAVYEIDQYYNIFEIKKYMAKNSHVMNLDRTLFDELWPIFEEILLAFNEGVSTKKYTLFDEKSLNGIFAPFFKPIYTDHKNIFIYQKIPK